MKILHKYVFRVCYKNLLKSYVTHVFFLWSFSYLWQNKWVWQDSGLLRHGEEWGPFRPAVALRSPITCDIVTIISLCIDSYRPRVHSSSYNMYKLHTPCACRKTCYILFVLFSSPSPPFKLRCSSFSHVQEWNYCTHYASWWRDWRSV